MTELEKIGKYEVLGLIGEGGFGTVYKARDPFMERLVAIKVCTAEDEQLRKRFLREAKIAGGLDHPNIVIAFDFGTEQDLPYLVQELLTGEDLRKKIDRQEPIDPLTKLDYLVQIAKGLQYAHSEGVLHRDIKPANVQILDDNRVKLVDFGMAKLATESGTRLTQDGAVMGTAGYFAPEQLKALELDQRVDVFSYGVLAYELLTYRKAFPGDSFMLVFRQVLYDEPEPLASLWSDCPAELTALVEKCLIKDREERYASFDEILPILFSLMGRAPFDRRSKAREREEAPELSATILVPGVEKADLHPAAPGDQPQPIDQPAAPAPAPVVPEASVAQTTAPSRPLPATRTEPLRASLASALKRILPPNLSSIPRPWLAGGGALLLVIVVGLWLLAGPAREKAAPAAEAQPDAEPAPIDLTPVPPPPSGSLYVEATPWGEIVQIIDATGKQVALPEIRYTPVMLSLAPGSYEVVVSAPESAESASCRIEIAEEASQQCLIQLSKLGVDEYFKEAGWWP